MLVDCLYEGVNGVGVWKQADLAAAEESIFFLLAMEIFGKFRSSSALHFLLLFPHSSHHRRRSSVFSAALRRNIF